MKISRKFTKQGQDPFASVQWVTRSSKIANPDGSVVFKMDNAEVPEGWSQLATDIMVSKYFRKAGVPRSGVPRRPARRTPRGRSSTASPGAGGTGARATGTSTPPRTRRRSTTRSPT